MPIPGNIISEKRNTLTITYAYDALGQLIRVNDPHENATWVYNYDRGGNIISKVKYAYTTDTLGTAQQTISYTYGDANWKDKLTAYNGTAISYDAIGNPLNDGTWTYTWQAGRQLKQMSKTGTTIRYEYNHEGLRTQKFIDTNNKTDATYYTYNGKNIIHVIKNSDHLHIFYDAQNRPAKVSHNGIFYTYLYNLQGDVVGLVDKDGTLVVEYKYDAWGKSLSITGTHANTLGKFNPFRYRGYVYDDETGLYCVRSRYYYPALHKFISADVMLGQIAGLKTHNAYEYCYSDPICYSDPSGNTAVDAYNFYQTASTLDGPYPWGDIVGALGALGIYLFGMVFSQATSSVTIGTNAATQSRPTVSPSPSPTPVSTAKPTIAPTPTPTHHQEYFPVNPLQFQPFGLIPKAYPPNAKVPTILKWSIPNSKIALFEWNYDAVNGSHYHVMLPSMSNSHLEGGHYRPGDMVPEPWNSLFFGDVSGEPWLYLE